MLQNKTVAMIGGGGFLGRAVAEKLARAGARLVVLARNPDKAKPLKVLGDPGQVSVLAGDALRDADVERLLAGADYLVNLAGILAPSGKQSFAAVHSELPARLGRLATAAGVRRIVHISALGADKDSPSAYARSRAAGEAGLQKAAPNSVILRPSIIFGPGDSFFNRFGRMAMLAPALPLIGGGVNRMQPVFVSDVAEAVLRSLTDTRSAGKIYELGGPKDYSFADLMRLVLEATARRRLLLPVPFFAMQLPAALASCLPNPPLTPDQLKLLKLDNLVSGQLPGLAELGIEPQPVEAHIQTHLAPFRPGGRFGAQPGRQRR